MSKMLPEVTVPLAVANVSVAHRREARFLSQAGVAGHRGGRGEFET